MTNDKSALEVRKRIMVGKAAFDKKKMLLTIASTYSRRKGL